MAGPYYVRSTDGSDASDGLTWANAKATLAGALAVAAAGETIYVSQVHAETQAAQMTLTSAGTAGARVRILGGNDAAEPPTALATTATITTTGTNGIFFVGFAYCYGCTFSGGTGAGSTTGIGVGNNAPFGWTFDTCLLACPLTGSNALLRLGTAAATSNDDVAVTLINTNLQPPGNAGGRVQLGGGRITIIGGALVTTSTPTIVFTPTISMPVDCEIRGMDLNLFGSGKSLVNVAIATSGLVSIEQCKLAASVALTSGANPGPGGVRVFLDNCDSADTQYRMQRHTYEGDVYSETTIVRTGGASNGTTPISWRMVSSANRELYDPLYSPEIVVWNDSVGASKTVTVEIVHDSVTALTDAEVWAEVEALTTSGFPLSTFASDRAADILATPASQTSSSVAWTTTGITNVNKQKLEVTFTPQEIGFFRVRIALAKASYTVYACPKVTVA